MDESLRHFNPNPTLSASLLSQGLFCWLNPLFKKGRKQQLDINDMYNVCPQDQSETLGSGLEKEWNKELKKRDDSGGSVKPSLFKALIRLFGLRYLLLGGIVFIEEAVRVGQPLLLGGLLRYFTPNSNVPVSEAYLYAMGVSMCAIVIAIAHHPYFFGVTRMGMQMRVACCSLMYKKALRLSNTAMGETTTGQIVNLMSNDVNRFDQAVIFLHFLWIGPLQAIAVLIILWYELGPSVLAGFAVLLLLIPVQGFMGRVFSKLRRKTAVHTDERVKVMNEIIAGMRVIKMYCWEKPFGELVEKIRNLEVIRIRRARYLQALILAPNFFSVKLILLLTFLTYVLVGGHMTTEKVFVTIAIYQAIRVPMTVFMPFAVQTIAEMRVTWERLQDILRSEEKSLVEKLKQKEDQRGTDISPLCLHLSSSFALNFVSIHRLELGFIRTNTVAKGMFDFLWDLNYTLYMIPVVFVLGFNGIPLTATALFRCMLGYKIVNFTVIGYMMLSVANIAQTVPVVERVEAGVTICSKEHCCKGHVRLSVELESHPVHDSCGVCLGLQWDSFNCDCSVQMHVGIWNCQLQCRRVYDGVSG